MYEFRKENREVSGYVRLVLNLNSLLVTCQNDNLSSGVVNGGN